MSRALRSATGLVIALLLLIGWAGQAMAAPASPEAASAPAASAPLALAPASLAPPAALSLAAARAEDFLPDYTSALDSVDAWWARHWSEYAPGSHYSSPSLYGGDPQLGRGIYDAPGDQVLCGPDVLGDVNAYYCPAGDFLAFDVDLLDFAWSMGDAVVWLAVSHEWGHAVQARLGVAQRAVQRELQADCFAGATLQGLVDDGSLTLEPGDMQELQAGLTAFADQHPWGAPGDHGSAAERWAALTTGMSGGFTGCLPV
jgi:predicted metalloprotease